MAFGRSDLERVWVEVYKPVTNLLGFEAVRIDERDNGKVKIDQIINEISTAADIIIGDLTYERPNCYFEIGYARAARKEDEVIFCARRDHIDHSGYKPKMLSFEPGWMLKFCLSPRNDPPKVHFDLAAFDILTWDLTDLDKFKVKFERRFKERLDLIRARAVIPIASTSPAQAAAPLKPTVDLDKIASAFRKRAEDK